MPAPAHEVSRRHLLRTTGTSLEGVSRPSLVGDELASAATMQLPDLSSTSIGALVKLRSDEETFSRVRRAFLELAEVVSQDDAHTYQGLQATVTEAADDLLGPLYDQLTAEVRRRSAFASVIGWGVTASLRLGFSGGAALVSGPAGGLAAKGSQPAAAAAGRFVGKKLKARNEPKEIARSLIVSTLPADRSLP